MRLISDEYLLQQREMHSRPRGYGGGGYKWAVQVASLAGRIGAHTILDYGCGQGTLAPLLRGDFTVREYDPAIPSKCETPKAADIVVCTDVLEHVEPEHLNAVLENIRYLTLKAALLVIACRPANKLLADGRNAHLIIEPSAWWIKRINALAWGTSVIEANERELVARCYR